MYDNSADNNNVGTEVKGAQPDRLHWSQAKPLSQNQVSNDDVPVNLADGHYDEAAQRARRLRCPPSARVEAQQ